MRCIPGCLAAALAAAALALLASCTFDFLNGDDADEPAPVYHYTYNSDNTIMYCLDQDDVLQWSEHYTYDADGNKLSLQRLSPSDELQYSYLYDWENGLNTVKAYFDGTGALRWYDHSIYQGDLLVRLCEYDGNGELQWFAVYEYSGSGLKTQAARYDGDSALIDAFVWEYGAAETLVTEKSYDASGTLCAKVTHEWSVDGKETRRIVYELPPSTPGEAARGITGLTLPTPPDPPAVPVLTLSDRELQVASRRFWFYDAYGATDVTTRADYLPTAIVREDARLAKAVTVALRYDEVGRILSKSTSYGDTEALRIVLTYASASGYLVSHIESSGAAMLIPLEFDLTYDEAGLPTQVTIGYDTSVLFALSYDYNEADPLTHTITVREGDGSLYGCYVFSVAGDFLSGRIDVYTDEACTVSNGYYALAYNDDSQTVSFAAYSAAGDPVVQYQYGYEDLRGLGEQALMVAESKFGFQMDDVQGAYEGVMEQIQAGDFDFTALLRIRSAEDVAHLFL